MLKWEGPKLSSSATLALLVVATVAARLPFSSQRLFSFDSANYAFALRDYYSVPHHQPHPPGYPLYVGLARLVDLAVGDPNRSLVVVSVLASAVAVALVFWLARSLYGTSVGVMAAVVLATAAGFWGYSEVAYPYTALAALSVGLAAVCWRMLQGAHGLAVPSAAFMGLAAGVRWDATAFLLPVWVWALWRTSLRARLLAAIMLAACVGLWAAPMVQLSGGPIAYWEALTAQSRYVLGTYSAVAGGGDPLRFNFNTLLIYLRASFGLPVLVVVFVLGRFFWPSTLASDARARFVLLWLAPALSVYLVVHIGDPGYLLSIAPILALLTAWGLAEFGSDARRVVDIVGGRHPRVGAVARSAKDASRLIPYLGLLLLAGWNTNVFLTAPGPARWPEIRSVDQIISSQLRFVIANLEPRETLVLAHDRYRQFHYYLPAWDVRLLFDEYRPDYERHRQTLQLGPQTRVVAVLDDQVVVGPLAGARVRRELAHQDPEVSVLLLETGGGRTIEYGYRHVAVVP